MCYLGFIVDFGAVSLLEVNFDTMGLIFPRNQNLLSFGQKSLYRDYRIILG